MADLLELEEPEKQKIHKIKLRVYGMSHNNFESHSCVVDNLPTGISTPIAELNINIKVMTLHHLRPIIEYDRSMKMNRRSLVFQEALFIMSRLPNYFNRTTFELSQYVFGFINKDGSGFRVLSTDEEMKPIGELIGAVDIFSHDLLLVPLSQIERL
eukprot:gene10353-13908_t